MANVGLGMLLSLRVLAAGAAGSMSRHGVQSANHSCRMAVIGSMRAARRAWI